MEPISPELVLVDPDLATRVRAVPAERPRPGPKRTLGDDAAAQRAGALTYALVLLVLSSD